MTKKRPSSQSSRSRGWSRSNILVKRSKSLSRDENEAIERLSKLKTEEINDIYHQISTSGEILLDSGPLLVSKNDFVLVNPDSKWVADININRKRYDSKC